jgi:hypothetical protein
MDYETKVLRMENGDIIISDVIELTQLSPQGDNTPNQKCFRLKAPLVLQIIPAEMMGGPQGRSIISLAPFLPGVIEETVDILADRVVASGHPDTSLVNLYKQKTSDIVIPPEKEILLPNLSS